MYITIMYVSALTCIKVDLNEVLAIFDVKASEVGDESETEVELRVKKSFEARTHVRCVEKGFERKRI